MLVKDGEQQVHLVKLDYVVIMLTNNSIQSGFQSLMPRIRSLATQTWPRRAWTGQSQTPGSTARHSREGPHRFPIALCVCKMTTTLIAAHRTRAVPGGRHHAGVMTSTMKVSAGCLPVGTYVHNCKEWSGDHTAIHCGRARQRDCSPHCPPDSGTVVRVVMPLTNSVLYHDSSYHIVMNPP